MPEKRRTAYWLGLGLLAATLLVYAQRTDLYGHYLEYKASADYLGALENERATLQHEADALAANIAGLETDQLEQEAAIRRNRKLVRDGETVFRFEPGLSGP